MEKRNKRGMAPPAADGSVSPPDLALKYDNDVFNVVPVLTYVVDRRCSPDWNIPPRRLHDYNLIVVLAGEAIVEFENGTYCITGGDYVLFSPGLWHCARTNPDNLMHCYAMHFSLAIATMVDGSWHLRSDQISLPLPAIGHMTASGPVIDAFRELLSISTVRPFGYELRRRSLVLEILFYLIQQHRLQKVDGHKARLVEEVADYLRSHYQRDLDLEEIASRSGFSPSYFGAIFRQVMGQTPIQYLNHIRINAAKDLLLGTAMPISEIAERVGIPDTCYFSRLFKRLSGMSPSVFRKLR